MTIYKVTKIIGQDTTKGKTTNVTVTRRKILGYTQEPEDADRFVRCYKLEYPNVRITVEPIDVGSQKGEEQKSAV